MFHTIIFIIVLLVRFFVNKKTSAVILFIFHSSIYQRITGQPCPRIFWKKTFEHTHIQGLSKTARTHNKCNIRTGLPPLPDKIRLVNIKRTLFPKFVKPLYAYIYHRFPIHIHTSCNTWIPSLITVYTISVFKTNKQASELRMADNN